MISPRTLPPHLVQKYATTGPRYTSYPTAPQFSEDFDGDDIAARWKATNKPAGTPLSLYVHLPFCRSRCLYCGCYTHIGKSKDTAAQYVDAMLREADSIRNLIDGDRPVQQLALGGGTPTFLRPETMRHLIEGLKQRFAFDPNGERSIEIDPRSVDEAYLDTLVELGFNRFSFGVQDLNQQVQKNIGRIQGAEHIRDMLDHSRSIGVQAINVDLIYGLPGQTPQSFEETIQGVIEMKPSRIALFGYAHVPWVSPHQAAMERHHIPDTDERLELFGIGYELLLEAGYAHIGMDHFALPDDELVVALNSQTLTRNFMGYTTRHGLDLVGLGASSISSVGTSYAQNTKDLAQYMEATEGSRWVKALAMNDDDVLRRAIIMELFCNFHLDIAKVEQQFGITFKKYFEDELVALKQFAADDLIDIKDSALQVSDLGRFFVRNICMVFDRYLTVKGRYSKTL